MITTIATILFGLAITVGLVIGAFFLAKYGLIAMDKAEAWYKSPAKETNKKQGAAHESI